MKETLKISYNDKFKFNKMSFVTMRYCVPCEIIALFIKIKLETKIILYLIKFSNMQILGTFTGRDNISKL